FRARRARGPARGQPRHLREQPGQGRPHARGDRGAARALGRLAPDLRHRHRREGARGGEGRRALVPGLLPAVRDRLGTITWEALVAETLAFGSPDTVARHIEYMRHA